jgi:hypothetical protein
VVASPGHPTLVAHESHQKIQPPLSICTEPLYGPPVPLWQAEVRFRTPTRLVPILVAFFLDSVGTGLASPLLPFYIMSLGANAFQLGTPTWTAVQ